MNMDRISGVSEFDDFVEVHGGNFFVLIDTKKCLFDFIHNILLLGSREELEILTFLIQLHEFVHVN